MPTRRPVQALPAGYQRFRNGTIGFRATLMEGPDVDLFAIAGLEATDELLDTVWGETNWQDLLAECVSAEVVPVRETGGGPGISDRTYRVQVSDPKRFARELREAIEAIVKSVGGGAE